MCGIAGYISMSDKRPNKTKVEEMFVEIESRGKDASGFSFFNEKNELIVAKAPLTATQLITKKTWKSLKKLPPIMIMHTRAATQGKSSNNENNHPIIWGDYTMVHNGVITNEAEFEVPTTTVDSLAILKSYEKHEEDIQKVFSSLEGSFAVAILKKNEPNTLRLFKHTNPIQLLFDKHDEILYFASTTFAVNKAKVKYETIIKNFILKDRYYEIDFPNNAYWKFTKKDGVKQYITDIEPKKITYTYNRNNYYGNHGYYGDYDSYGAYGSEDEQLGLYVNNRYLPAKKKPEETESYSIYDADSQFLEFLTPETYAEYQAINDKLATSDLIAIECPECQKPSLINIHNEKHYCMECKKEIKRIAYAN